MFSVKYSQQALLFSVLLVFSRLSAQVPSIVSAYFRAAQDEISGAYIPQQTYQEPAERQKALQFIDSIMRDDHTAITAMGLEALNTGGWQLYMDRASLLRHRKDGEAIPEEFVGLWLGGENALGLALFYVESIDPTDTARRTQSIETIKLLLAWGVLVAGMGYAYFARDSRDGKIRDYVPLCNCTEKYVSPEILPLLLQHGLVLKHHLHSHVD